MYHGEAAADEARQRFDRVFKDRMMPAAAEIPEQEIPSESIVPLLRMRHADVEIVEARVPMVSPMVGSALRELNLPQESTIALIIRGGQPIFPDGGTVLRAGDEVVAFTRSTHESELRELFFSRR